MRVWAGKILVAALALALIGACSSKGAAVEVGETAPNFMLNDLNGKVVNLSDFKGKVVILNFFATWCPPCRVEIPTFIELQKTYESKGFTFIGVSLVYLRESKDFAEKSGINYPVLIDNGSAKSLYGPIRAIPTTFVLDKDMKVVKKYIGLRMKNVFEGDIKEILQ